MKLNNLWMIMIRNLTRGRKKKMNLKARSPIRRNQERQFSRIIRSQKINEGHEAISVQGCWVLYVNEIIAQKQNTALRMLLEVPFVDLTTITEIPRLHNIFLLRYFFFFFFFNDDCINIFQARNADNRSQKKKIRS